MKSDTSENLQFVVQRGKSVPTLSSVASLRSRGEVACTEEEKHRKEQQNQDTKSEELGESEHGTPHYVGICAKFGL